MKIKPLGVYALFFGIVSVLLTVFLGLFFKAGPYVILIISLIALISGILVFVKYKNEKDTAALVMAIIGVLLAIIPFLGALFFLFGFKVLTIF